MDIRNSLYINIKNDDQTSNLIVGSFLKFKENINSKDDKHLLVDNLSKRVDDYKKIFTTMKDNNIINLTEQPKKSSTESNKRKIFTYEQKTRYPLNKIINIKRKK